MITKRYHFDCIDSTNVKVKELAAQGAAHGTLVTAESQSAGIGRRGRSWSSEEGTGIYMSILLRPQIETNRASMLTLVAAMAVQKAIQGTMIKWPNDIVVDGKKICGILTELSLSGTKIDYVVIGIGINVNNKVFPEEIKETASSLSLTFGREFDKELLISEVWKHFAVYYEQFLKNGDLTLLQEAYERVLVNKDEKVKVLDPLGEYVGIAKGITNIGELIVETEGEIRQVSSGEVSVRGIYGYV